MLAVTLELDQAYDDISNVYVWTPTTTNQAFDYVSIWLSPTTNYSAGTLCAGSIALLEGSAFESVTPATFLCPNTTNAKYVTIVRQPVVTTGEALALDEVVINRGGKGASVQVGPLYGSSMAV